MGCLRALSHSEEGGDGRCCSDGIRELPHSSFLFIPPFRGCPGGVTFCGGRFESESTTKL